MPVCKKCGSSKNIKSGKVNDKQRYECKECGCHFMEGEARTNEKIKAKKALCVLLYSLGKYKEFLLFCQNIIKSLF